MSAIGAITDYRVSTDLGLNRDFKAAEDAAPQFTPVNPAFYGNPTGNEGGSSANTLSYGGYNPQAMPGVGYGTTALPQFQNLLAKPPTVTPAPPAATPMPIASPSPVPEMTTSSAAPGPGDSVARPTALEPARTIGTQGRSTPTNGKPVPALKEFQGVPNDLYIGSALVGRQGLSFSLTREPILNAAIFDAQSNNREGVFSRQIFSSLNLSRLDFAPGKTTISALVRGDVPRATAGKGGSVVAQRIESLASSGQLVTYGNFSDGTAFSQWARRGAIGPVPSGSQNCWEMILSSAISSGRLSPEKVATAYRAGMPGIQNLLTNDLRNVSRYDGSTSSTPKVGDLIYFKLTNVDGSPWKDLQGRSDPTPLLAHVGLIVGYGKDGRPIVASHFPKNSETSTKPVQAPL
jgi:hypothetical protein